MSVYILTAIDRIRDEDSAVSKLTVTGYTEKPPAVAAQVEAIVTLTLDRPIDTSGMDRETELDFLFDPHEGTTRFTYNVKEWFWYKNLYKHFLSEADLYDPITIESVCDLVWKLPLDQQIAFAKHANALLQLDQESEIAFLVEPLTFS